jgi:hypothetical protein
MNTENNKLLAEFFGGKYKNQTNIPLNDNEIWLPKFGVCHLGNNGKVLKFHNDWNWLMEVVEKIESLEFYPKNSTCIGFDSFGVEINKKRCDITRYGDFTLNLLQGNGSTRIESVYNACVEFIKWYNENK